MRFLLTALLLVACGGSEPTKTEPAKAEPAKVDAAKAEAPKADAHGDHAAGAGFGAFTQIAGPGKKVFFMGLQDGATVKSPFKVQFGVEGVAVKPAGDFTPASGHHHIVIDGAPIGAGQAVPKDEKNIHYGKGETEAELTLTPGPHTLTLQLADFAHRSYGPELSATVKIVVE
jgi:hypothetical protein